MVEKTSKTTKWLKKQPKQPDNDTDNVNETDTVTVTVNENETDIMCLRTTHTQL